MIWTGAKARSVLLLRHVHCSGLVPGHDEDKSGKSMIKTGAKALLGYTVVPTAQVGMLTGQCCMLPRLAVFNDQA